MIAGATNEEKHAESRSQKDAIWELIRTLVQGGASASEILEIYYWSRDPSILQMLRRVVCLPEESRRQVIEFLAMSDVKNISAKTQTSPPRLILTA